MVKYLKEKIHPNKISIKITILIMFIIILFSTVGLIGYITYSSWINSTNDIIAKTVDALNDQIVDEIDRFIISSRHLNLSNKKLIEKDLFDMDDEKKRELLFVNELTSFENDAVYSFSYGSEKGEYYGARRNANNTIEIMRNNGKTDGHSYYYAVNEDKEAGELVVDAGEFDSRTRPWYKIAKEKNMMTFSSIYKHFILDDLAISLSTPISGEDGQAKGVLASHINLSRFNKYLEEVVEAENAYAIILEKESGELVANSLNIQNFNIDKDGNFQRLKVNELAHEEIEEAYKGYIASGLDNYIIEDKDDKLNIKLNEYRGQGLDWVIITVLPDSLMIGPIKDNIKIVLLLTFLAMFISSITFFIFTRKYLSPINSLIKAQEEFANGDLLKRVKLVRKDEIGLLSNSFNYMADTIYTLINTLEDRVEERTSELNKANIALEENKNQLQLILDSAAEGIYGVDLNEKGTFINASGVRMLGYEDQRELIGKNMHRYVHHSYKDGSPMPIEDCNIFKALKEGKSVYANDEVFWKKDGTSFSVAYYFYPQVIDGKTIGSVATFIDNTESKKMKEMLFNEKEHFKTTLLSVGEGIISTDNKGIITVMNPVAEKLTGWSKEDAYGKHLEEVLTVIDGMSGQECESLVEGVLESKEIVEMNDNIVLVSKDDKRIPIENSASPIKDRDGNVSGVVIVLKDVTDKNRKIKKIRYLSMHDQLTGLYNRWYIKDAMSRLDTERNLPLTIMSIDVNGLKLVNDAFGHEMGNELLKSVSKILKNTLRTEDIIARIGGDELLVLLPKTSELEAKKIKERIKKASSKEKLGAIVISLAIGYAVKENKHESLEKTILVADDLMYKDKLKYGQTMKKKTVEKILDTVNMKYHKGQIHTERLAKYSESIAKAMNFNEEEILDIKTAEILHDIGQIIVPKEIFDKSEKLTDEEFELVKKHPETSYHILKSVDEYAKIANDVLHHHERWDGSGYPKGLKGDEIPINSRILAVVDAYEEITKKVKSKEKAISELKRCSGTKLDPEIVKIFIYKVLKTTD